MNVEYLNRSGKPRLAYIYSPPSERGMKYPMAMFLGGYRSDMQGTKATYFEKQCQARGQAYLRFDYSGHGLSGGAFEDGTIGAWLDDAQDIFDHVSQGPAVLVGSSMGGWVGLLLALRRAGIVQGMVGIAAAPDFTEQMYHERLNDAQRQELHEKGYFEVPNDYHQQPYKFTRNFYEEAKNHLLLNKSRSVDFSLRIIQGMKDEEVPWETAVKIQKTFSCAQSDIILIEDGDHRLSRPEDLEIIDKEIKSISGIL
jgi:pimeloyl-ACP methyl ester carboxylesterase